MRRSLTGEMARTATKTTLLIAKTSRIRRETFPISSAGMRPPRPHPGPPRPAEKCSDHREHDGYEDEPGHHPPRDRTRTQVFRPARPARRNDVGVDNKAADQSCRDQHRPGTEYCEENDQWYQRRKKLPQVCSAIGCPDRLAPHVDVEVRNHDKRNHHKRWNDDPCHERRKIMEQFLQAEKIPGCLGWVWRDQRISELFEWSVPEKGDNNHRNK